MSAIVLDECLFYLKEAEDYLSLYKELDPYEEIFEAYTPNTQLQVDQNAKAKTGVMGSLTKACKAVLNMIRKIKDSIRDFFTKRKLDDKQREAYESFKKACEKDPSLKNKKVTVQNFNKVNADYNKILKEAEDADRQLAEGRAFNTDAIINKMGNFCKDITSGITVAVGCEAALNIASSSREMAQKMYVSLKQDEELEQKLIEAIGEKETKRFEKQMKSLGKRVSLHRGIMKMKGTYSKSVENAIDNTFNSVFDLIENGTNIAKTTKDLDSDVNIKGNAFDRAKQNVTYVAKNAKTLATNGAGIAKNSDMIRRAYGNTAIKKTAKDYMDSSSQATKEARKIYKDTLKAQKNQNKRHNVHNQSMLDSFLGTNDPNSATKGVGKAVDKIRRLNPKYKP